MQSLPGSMPDLAVRHGPLDTVEAVQSLIQQCEDIAVKQYLVTATCYPYADIRHEWYFRTIEQVGLVFTICRLCTVPPS